MANQDNQIEKEQGGKRGSRTPRKEEFELEREDEGKRDLPAFLTRGMDPAHNRLRTYKGRVGELTHIAGVTGRFDAARRPERAARTKR